MVRYYKGNSMNKSSTNAKTTSVKDINIAESKPVEIEGVIWHTNPLLECIMSAGGQVINSDTKKVIEPSKANGLYQIRFIGDKYTNPMSFNSLVKYLIGVDKMKNDAYVLIDETKGWVKDNIEVKKGAIKLGRKPGQKYPKKGVNDTVHTSQVKTLSIDEYSKSSIVEINGFKARQIIKEPKYTTEDGMVFNNRVEASEHQHFIDIGKTSAEIIVENKSGYKLAELIFLQHVKYPNGQKPYKNFKNDVYENNSGIVGSSDATMYILESDPKLSDFKDLVKDKHLTKDELIAVTTKIVEVSKLTNEILEILT